MAEAAEALTETTAVTAPIIEVDADEVDSTYDGDT